MTRIAASFANPWLAIVSVVVLAGQAHAFQPTTVITHRAVSAKGYLIGHGSSVAVPPSWSSKSLALRVSENNNDNNNNNSISNTPARRMRLRKVKIYNQRKVRGTVLLMAFWYALSVAFNIYSKRVLVMAPELAWTSAWAQMAFGLLYVLPIWASGSRAVPEVSGEDLKKRILPVALLHTLVHVGGVISMGAGAVSFTYIVKATEPAVSALLAAVVLKSFLPIPVYLTLVPVIAGVSLASVSELTFNWKAFNYAMMSNVASASRGIVSKKTMSNRVGKNLTAMNLYAILTIMSTIILLPIAAMMEGSVWKASFTRLYHNQQLGSYVFQTLLAALSYYTYNEVSFRALDNISPVSHALASTLRRVFIITSSMLVFGNKMTPTGVVGSTMAVGGALLYSAAKNHYKKKQAV